MTDNDKLPENGDEAWARAKIGKGKEWNSSSPFLLIAILIAGALIIAAMVLGVKGMDIPAIACMGAFVLCVVTILSTFAIVEKVRLKRAKNIVGKPGMRRVTATVIKSELFSRKTLGEDAHSKNRLPGLHGVTVSAVYKVWLRDGVLTYTALCKTRYKKYEKIEVYINGNTVYVDETPPADSAENTPQEIKND